jgi:quinol monooxygenase YgiN
MSEDINSKTVRLTGRLICASAAEVEIVRRHLPEHIRLSRAEPGCLSFEVVQGDDPLVWHLAERFTDKPAFEAHQARTRASEWWRESSAIRREFQFSAEV